MKQMRTVCTILGGLVLFGCRHVCVIDVQEVNTSAGSHLIHFVETSPIEPSVQHFHSTSPSDSDRTIITGQKTKVIAQESQVIVNATTNRLAERDNIEIRDGVLTIHRKKPEMERPNHTSEGILRRVEGNRWSEPP